MSRVLLAGDAHPGLAREISRQAGITQAAVSIASFADGETRVRIEDDVRGAEVVIVQPLSAPANERLVALAAHPRIGERAAGEGRQARWSRGEQSGVTRTPEVERALLDGNRAYEERFDRVFLICATGLGAEEILAALHARLGNDPATEERVVADELRKIAILRLRKVLSA